MDIINFDIENLKNEISVEDAGVYIPSDGIAKDNDAFSLIEWVETRNLLINDLVKVKKRLLLFIENFFIKPYLSENLRNGEGHFVTPCEFYINSLCKNRNF